MSTLTTTRAVEPLSSRRRLDEREFGSATTEIQVRRRILLASPDPVQGLMVHRRLEMDGYEVTTHETDRDVVLSLVKSSADLLLINARPQDRAAVALIRWARARRETRHTTCMAIVAPDDSRLIADLYDAGADFVMMRRTQLDLLSRKVTAALARRPLALAG